MLARRNAWLSKTLGMSYDKSLLGETTDNQQLVKTELNAVVPVEDEQDLSKSLLVNQKQLERIVEVAEEVMDQSADAVSTLQKSRDIEAFANLLGKINEVQGNLVSIKEKRLGKEAGQKMPHTAIQNNITIQNTRQLNEILKGQNTK